jgi:hypothetical protein
LTFQQNEESGIPFLPIYAFSLNVSAKSAEKSGRPANGIMSRVPTKELVLCPPSPELLAQKEFL